MISSGIVILFQTWATRIILPLGLQHRNPSLWLSGPELSMQPFPLATSSGFYYGKQVAPALSPRCLKFPVFPPHLGSKPGNGKQSFSLNLFIVSPGFCHLSETLPHNMDVKKAQLSISNHIFTFLNRTPTLFLPCGLWNSFQIYLCLYQNYSYGFGFWKPKEKDSFSPPSTSCFFLQGNKFRA